MLQPDTHMGVLESDATACGNDACCAPTHSAADVGSCCGAEASVDLPVTDGEGLTFQIEGLDCGEEVAILKSAVGAVAGGQERLRFDVLNGRMTVMPGDVAVQAEQIRQAVASTGMSARLWTPGGPPSNEADENRRREQTRFTVASGLALIAGVVLHVWQAGSPVEAVRLLWGGEAHGAPLPATVAYGLATIFGGRFVLPKAWYAARRLRPDIHLLMMIAVIGAITIGDWFEAATVAFLFALSLALESWSVGRARRAISALLDLAPTMARVKLDDGRELETLAVDVAVGTHFVVRPGERIPLDGQVAAGSSTVDQAPITGESVPVLKETGADVFAGTVNGDGALEVESTRRAENTTLARITRLVEQSHAQRARAEQWVERFARIYTPAVIVLAVGVCLVPPLLLGGLWTDWFYRALVLLVVSCPCALVISTPVSIVAALATAARHGVLVKGGVFLELPARLRVLAFDKTGTLTRGEAEVVAVLPVDGHSETELLERAAALEIRSTHPLARAVIAHARRRGIAPGAALNIQVLGGRGVTGTYEGKPLWLGSRRFFAQRGFEVHAVNEAAKAFEAKGQTVVLIGDDEHVCGLLALADTVRPEAAAALAALRALGIDHLIMLTGDNRATAEVIAGQVGIDEVHADLLPENKLAVVERLVTRHHFVGMVGDGVNDAPAMARASLGIAMGAAGSDAAIETADVALMTDELSRLPWLIGLSRRTLRVIHQNVAVSLVVKAGFVALTVAGVATLWGAIVADMGVSLLVVANGLRLLRAGDSL